MKMDTVETVEGGSGWILDWYNFSSSSSPLLTTTTTPQPQRVAQREGENTPPRSLGPRIPCKAAGNQGSLRRSGGSPEGAKAEERSLPRAQGTPAWFSPRVCKGAPGLPSARLHAPGTPETLEKLLRGLHLLPPTKHKSARWSATCTQQLQRRGVSPFNGGEN